MATRPTAIRTSGNRAGESDSNTRKGFTELWATVGTGAAVVTSIGPLSIPMRTLPVGKAYAVWMELRGPAGMMLFNPNYFIHVGNILLLVAYSVRDILWLRLFALAAALITIPFFVLQPTPLWAPLIWSAVFATINLVQSLRLFIERRPVQLSAEEEEVRRLAMAALPPRKVLQVLSIGSWITAEAGERFIVSGKRVESVWLIIRGKVQVTRGARVLGELGPGHLVGSALLLSGVPADIDASPSEPVRAVRWEADPLQKYLAANPEVRVIVQRFLAQDLVGKLEHFSREHQLP